MNLGYQDLVPALAGAFPELQPLLDEHVNDFDEILPTLFMADVARWATARASTDRSRVAELTAWLEHHDEEDSDEVGNLIGVGFVESLPRYNEPGAEILELLGPRLQAVAEEMGLLRGSGE